jgi:hypothetical protein
LKIVGHGRSVLQGSGVVTIVSTSLTNGVPNSDGVFPRAPCNDWMTTCDGDRPWLLTNSPQLALDTANAVTSVNELNDFNVTVCTPTGAECAA